MRVTRKTIAYSMVLAALAAPTAGCGDKKPGTDAFRASISQTIAGYSIKELKCESFADKTQEGGGRASCRGTLALAGDLYAQISPEEATALLVAAGIPASGAAFFSNRHLATIFDKSVNGGTETPFTANCTYMGDVDGPRVGCNTSFSRFNGQPLGTFGSDTLIKGSPEYMARLNAIVADYRRLDASYKALKAQMDRFFSPGRTISSPGVRARLTSPLTWTGEPGFLGYPGYFSVQTKYQDLRDHTTGTFCGYPIGNPRDDIQYNGRIDFNKDRDTGEETFVSKIDLRNRAIQYQNQFQGCSLYYTWNGTTFRDSATQGEVVSR